MIIYGINPVLEALRAGRVKALRVGNRADDRLKQLLALAAERGVPVRRVPADALERESRRGVHQGVVAEIEKAAGYSLDEIVGGASSPPLLVVVDGVEDPHNLGAILRTADAAGADGVILTGHSVDAYNPKVVRSTTGSIFHIPVAQGISLEAALDAVRAAGVRILAADIKGDDLPDIRAELSQPTAWLFGNEARGLSDESLGLADRVVKVPIYGHAESLNLATAASVCLYQSAFAQR